MKLTIKDILAAKRPSDIFTSEGQRKEQYKKLVRIFHPDVCKITDKDTCVRVMQIVNELYTKPFKDQFEFDTKSIEFEHVVKTDFGFMYVDTNKLYFLTQSRKLVESYPHAMPYESEVEEKKVSLALPEIVMCKHSATNSLLTTNRPLGFDPLELVKDSLGTIPPRHIAWMISRLLYLCCYMEHNNIINGGLNMKTLFVDTKNHMMWFPNWFFYTEIGQPLKGLNNLVKNVLPTEIISKKVADKIIDQESIKLIGRCLGESEGQCEKFLKKPIKIGTPSVDLFKEWSKALDDTYGPRKFVEFPKYKI